MRTFQKLQKLQRGDKVAIVSPSFAAPGKWPQVYALGLERLRTDFGLEPVDFPTTSEIGASKDDRARDLVAAFGRDDIKAVIASLGGNDQVTYIKHLRPEDFVGHAKPYFGYSDNTHIMNFLWLCGIPSYYGGALFTQFAMQGGMEAFTTEYIRRAFFDSGEFELRASDDYNDIGLDWNNPDTLHTKRTYEPNDDWHWDGAHDAVGRTWGGCLESIDELLRNGIEIPSLEDFADVVLMTETSEEIPPADYVHRVYRALGERGVLARLRGVLVGRPKAWEFGHEMSAAQKEAYRAQQRDITLKTIREYNPTIPVVQNMDFGHTNPQIPMPYGGMVRIVASERRVFAEF